ncbi:hypothetical protein P692DRAFT_20296779 [Suillus brevipes Sb2]|nr:hypothetical protein P692DRAFT_20296779 [Suillus brevipes Sb2]
MHESSMGSHLSCRRLASQRQILFQRTPKQPFVKASSCVCRFLRPEPASKKFSKPSKGSRNCIPASQNIDAQGAPSGQKAEDNNHLTTPEIPSDSVSQGLSGEPSSQVRPPPSGEEEGPDHQLAVAELQSARDGIQSVGLLGRHATPMASAGVNAPADLDAMDTFETTYLQPLKIVDAVLEKIANVWPGHDC